MLVHLAHEHSPRVEVHGQDLVVMDISGLKHLWGSPREVGERLRRVAAERDLSVRVAIAGDARTARSYGHSRRRDKDGSLAGDARTARSYGHSATG